MCDQEKLDASLLAAKIRVVMAINPNIHFDHQSQRWCCIIGVEDPYKDRNSQPGIIFGNTLEQVMLSAYEYIKTGVKK